MGRLVCLVLLLVGLSGCGDQEAIEDVCGLDFTWNGETYHSYDGFSAPPLGESLDEPGRMDCGHEHEEPTVAAVRGLDPAVSVAVLPPNMYAPDRVTYWLRAGSPEHRSASTAACLKESGAMVRLRFGDLHALASFTPERGPRQGRWAEWWAEATDTDPLMRVESHNLAPTEAELLGRCLDDFDY